MGAYLSTPVTEKECFEGIDNGLEYGGCAMQGWRRTMEDAHIAQTCIGPDNQMSVFGVFDGHGGAEVAKFCQKYLVQELLRMETLCFQTEDCLVQIFHRMDEMLRDVRFLEELESLKNSGQCENDDEAEEGEGSGSIDALDLLKKVFQLKRFMSDPGQPPQAKVENENPDPCTVQSGCTAVVALKLNNMLYVANAGDSRGVLCREGKAYALSEDHKPAQEFERARILAAGGFLSEIGGVCRVNGNLNLSRAIGDLKYKVNSGLHVKDQIITAQPDITKVLLTNEDTFFILACDGVWDVMSNQEAVDFVQSRLREGLTPKQVAVAMLDACLANDPKEARGVGCDNMTAIIVKLK